MQITRIILLGAVAALAAGPALAQDTKAQPPSQPDASQWQELPRMKLEAQFGGPLRDTIIQRWRDPGDGSVCYLYLPIAAPHSPPAASGFVQYGANNIGSISCFANPSGRAVPQPSAAAPSPRAAPRSKK